MIKSLEKNPKEKGNPIKQIELTKMKTYLHPLEKPPTKKRESCPPPNRDMKNPVDKNSIDLKKE
jgi:hypothetical protein